MTSRPFDAMTHSVAQLRHSLEPNLGVAVKASLPRRPGSAEQTGIDVEYYVYENHSVYKINECLKQLWTLQEQR